MADVFVHDGLAIAVQAPSHDVDWLAEFLGPSYERSRGSPDVTVAFEERVSPPAGRADGPGRLAFALDSGPIVLPVAEEAGTCLVESEAAVAHEVAAPHATVWFWGDRGAARVRWMRVVREFAHNWSVGTGGVVLHAGAVTTGDVAVAVVGPKAGGKTTLVARLLSVGQTSLLANDRLLVRGGPWRGIGIPTVISVRPGTLALLPDLHGRLRSSGDFHQSSRERRVDGGRVVVTHDDRIRVSGDQFAAALGRPHVGEAPLGAILFPTADGATTRIDPLGPDEAANALAAGLLGRPTATYGSDVFVVDHLEAPGEEELHARCRDITAGVPAYSVSLADEAPTGAVEAMLHQCTKAGT